MDEKIMMDTQGFVNSCRRFPNKLILTASCEKCEYHQGILEVWPGDKGQPVEVKAAEMTEEFALNDQGIETGKNHQYDIVCGLPMRTRVSMFAKFADNENETGG